MKNILKIVLAVGAALAVVAGVLAWRWYNDNKRPNFRHEAVIYVYPGDDAGEVMKTIADSAGVLRMSSLVRAFEDKKVSEYIQPGRYVVKPSSSSVYAARMLNNGWQSPTRLVLSGTMRGLVTCLAQIRDKKEEAA